jgi:hypothetical protein
MELSFDRSDFRITRSTKNLAVGRRFKECPGFNEEFSLVPQQVEVIDPDL